jgi:hypothetical protein
VKSAELAIDPYDIVIQIQGKDIGELSKMGADKLLSIKVVGKTITLMVFSWICKRAQKVISFFINV